LDLERRGGEEEFIASVLGAGLRELIERPQLTEREPEVANQPPVQRVKGSEMDDSTTWKIAEDLYLLTWVEERQAVGAVLLMDFAEMRNVGVLFGRDDNGSVHTLCGARLTKLGEISYPVGYEPPGVNGCGS
jgi:hypothetical protein